MIQNFPLETSIAVITGTHSAGKSTLVGDFEQGKLSDLGLENREYPDLGFGVIDTPTGERPLIIVPETARWYADELGRPDFLGENYNLPFQLDIDFLAIDRVQAAVGSTGLVAAKLRELGKVSDTVQATLPIVLSDRSSFDGLIYSHERISDQETDIIDGFARAGFHAHWMRSFVNLVIIADHTEVEFEHDETRLDDATFRDTIAESMVRNYKKILPIDAIQFVIGNPEARKAKVATLLGAMSSQDKAVRLGLPYADWPDVRIS
ncbi:MAG: hypothetical protein ABIP50_00175 [Candidatus Saccharimonadales bacterium]